MKTRSAQTLMICFAFSLLFVLTTKTSAEIMKIAVASSGQAKDAAISQQAARTPYFLFFDDRGNLLESIENPAREQSRQAGPDAALFLVEKGVTMVIAGEFGNKMIKALEEHQIHYFKKTGVVYHAVQTIIQDR